MRWTGPRQKAASPYDTYDTPIYPTSALSRADTLPMRGNGEWRPVDGYPESRHSDAMFHVKHRFVSVAVRRAQPLPSAAVEQGYGDAKVPYGEECSSAKLRREMHSPAHQLPRP